MNPARQGVAVVGAGMAGAPCARGMADAGPEVQLVDESRGTGGRQQVDGKGRCSARVEKG